MIFSAATGLGRYFAPRSRSSRWCMLVVLTVLIIVVVGYRSGFLHYLLENKVLGRKVHTRDELVAMIPFEINKQIFHEKGPVVDHVPAIPQVHSNPSSLKCRSLDPKVVFAIRIAKCASTTFVQLLQALSKSSAFDLFFHPSGAFEWDARTMKRVAGMARAKRSRFVYARHFYYVDFHPYDLQDYTYITLVRDPVTRFVSSYLYYHFSNKKHIRSIVHPAHKNETLTVCLEHQHEGCRHNLMTKYFCGHHRFCHLGNEQALNRAKENLRKEFAVVGVVEEMKLSLKLLAKIIPKYFGKLDLKEPGVINSNEHKINMTEFEVEQIKTVNHADMELYTFAKDLLHKRAEACGLTSSEH